jgi:hypothetical protein
MSKQTELLKKYGFKEEVWEVKKDNYQPTGYPAPVKKYYITWELYNMSIESAYFWVLNYLRDWGYHDFIKTTDVFAAAENSAFFGVTQQRMGLQQDKVSQFLATIGKMVKEMFQLVRELRIIDERLTYYKESYAGIESSEITLKGIWIDMVEGGTKNPASVYGMAREVQFTSLPDLFFSTNPKNSAEVDRVVDTQRAGFNKSVRNVLKRKLKTYMEWKKRTFQELKTRRIFTIKYLKQHYDIIKMYMTWIKPYLRHIRRLTLDEDRVLTPDMVAAFEGSMIEIEYLCHKWPVNENTKKKNEYYKNCTLVNFVFRTRPSMAYQQEGYQRGPIHVGKLEFTLRGYVWTEDDIENYKKLKEREDLELMKTISESVRAAMESLGGELESYLEEAKEHTEGEEETEKERFSRQFLKGKKPKPKAKPAKKVAEFQKSSEKSTAKKVLKAELFDTFKNFKKAHGLLQW